jgi:hypothetical protein
MGAFNVINRASMAGGLPENVGDVVANFDALATLLNGNLDDFNVKVAAGIAISKLAGYPADATKLLAGDASWKQIASIISHTQITANVVSGAVSEATAVTAITAPTFTPDGVSPYSFEVFTPDLSNGNIQAGIFVSLHDGAAFVGQLVTIYNGGTTVASSGHGSVMGRYRYIPTATPKTYTARLWAFGGNSTLAAGLGGPGAYVPAYLRITKDI